MDSETLSEEELAEISGHSTRGRQRNWLDERNWHYTLSRGGRPVVGRLYARMKLNGPEFVAIKEAPPPAPPAPPVWSPDFSRVH
jgi:hypothetical protein